MSTQTQYLFENKTNNAAIKDFKNNPSPIHFIGIGHAGLNVVLYLKSKDIDAKFTCIANGLTKANLKNINFINLNSETEIKPKNEHAATHLSEKILDVFRSSDKFVLLSGFGGQTGSNLTEALSLYLEANKKTFLVISSLPLKLEGEYRNNTANKALETLKHKDYFFHFKHDTLLDISDEELTIKKSLELADEQFYKIIYSLNLI